jgi:putative thioredoxin
MNPALHGAVDLSSLVNKRDRRANPQEAPGIIRAVDDSSIAELVELSRTVPVILEVYGGELKPQLGPLIESYRGRFVLGQVRAESAPELVQALQIQGIPTVLAILGGQPVPLFQGIPPEAEMRPILDQVLDLATKNGVTGSVAVSDSAGHEEPGDDPLPPLHQEAFDALSTNDTAGAKEAFKKALAQNPADADAEAGLAQVELLERVGQIETVAARAAAADSPEDHHAAMAVADLDMAGGHVDNAFERLLGLFPSLGAEAKDEVRSRLLAYFVIAGSHTEQVKQARIQLANLMF